MKYVRKQELNGEICKKYVLDKKQPSSDDYESSTRRNSWNSYYDGKEPDVSDPPNSDDIPAGGGQHQYESNDPPKSEKPNTMQSEGKK